MPRLVGIGGGNDQLNSSNSGNNESNAFKVEITFSTNERGEALFWRAASEYLELFGLFRTDDVLEHWSLFYKQYDATFINDFVTETVNHFKRQNYFIEQFKLLNVQNWTLEINVPNFFIDKLSKFGIEVRFNQVTKKVDIVKFDPIKMVAWEDLLKADIFCVGGTGIASTVIKAGTMSVSSHTAMYAGDNFVIESLENGITRRTKEQFLHPSECVNFILVKRHRESEPNTRKLVVDAANDNVNAGVPPRGKNPIKYNWGGLAGAGAITPSGAGIAAVFPIVRVPDAIYGVSELARKGANKLPYIVAPPNNAVNTINAAKFVFGGPPRYFCSQAIIVWCNEAGIPITFMPPDKVAPKLIAESFFDSKLETVGYLRYMPE